MKDDYPENVIEWMTGQKRISCSFTQKKYINKVLKLHEKYPDEVDYIMNKDGSIFCHLPLKALKLNIVDTSNRQITEDMIKQLTASRQKQND